MNGLRLPSFQIISHALGILKPLALLLYEKIIPGSQLMNALEDMDYRVKTINTSADLTATAQQEGAILVLADLEAGPDGEVISAIKTLHQHPDTAHVPVIAYCPAEAKQLDEYARLAGAKLVVNEETILAHLPDFLEQALKLD